MQSGTIPNFCPQCGTQASSGSRYCVTCGASFNLAQADTAAVNSDSVRAVELPRAPAKEQSSWFATWGWILWAAVSFVAVMATQGSGNTGYSFGIAIGFYGVSVAIAAVPTAIALLVNYLRKVKWRAESYLWILFVTGSMIAGLATVGNKMSDSTIKRLDRERRSQAPLATPQSIVSTESPADARGALTG